MVWGGSAGGWVLAGAGDRGRAERALGLLRRGIARGCSGDGGGSRGVSWVYCCRPSSLPADVRFRDGRVWDMGGFLFAYTGLILASVCSRSVFPMVGFLSLLLTNELILLPFFNNCIFPSM